MTRTQTIARNIRLRVAMLLAHAPTWDVVGAQRAAGLNPAQWSRFQGGRERYCSDAMLDRIATGLWLEDGQSLLLSPTAVVSLPIEGYTDTERLCGGCLRPPDDYPSDIAISADRFAKAVATEYLLGQEFAEATPAERRATRKKVRALIHDGLRETGV